ncbi:hypothetical protein F3Y22_tig00110458pilonHSYRG00089 [Hibiscus syriacus]|uniref:Uncharacterized protein n=1 Tax=Hibiscus syriacus TaxID=106335 RepID=A0A6A3AMI4_HIBSY|nr:hypothetical protein F3Y22_tig00110458pilonHSYRG00089 [Hibiscus syriacus]
MVYGSRISVSFAKYILKDTKKKCVQSSFAWKSNFGRSSSIENSQSLKASQGGESRKEVVGYVDEVELRKLRICLVGIMAGVCSVGSIVDRLQNWGLGEIRVQRLRGNTFLLTIEDEDLFIILEDLQWSYLKEIFMDIMLWTESLSHKERVVWIELDGLPLHCWNEITLKRLAGLWGRFETFGENVNHLLDCEKVNMLISTTLVARIDEVVDDVVEKQKFGVRVLKVGMVDHSIVKLIKSGKSKEKEIGDEKDGVEIGADKDGGISENLATVSSETSSSRSSGDKNGNTLTSGGAFNIAYNGDNLGDCRKDGVGNMLEVDDGFDVGRERDGFQSIDHSLMEGGQGVGDGGVESKALGCNETNSINDGITLLEDRDKGVGVDVGSLENGLPSYCNNIFDDLSGMGFPDVNCVSLVASGEKQVGIQLGSFNPSVIGSSLSDSILKKRWDAASFEAEKTLALGKILGIEFVGSKSEVFKDLASVDRC